MINFDFRNLKRLGSNINLNKSKRFSKAIIAGTCLSMLLTGCNRTIFDSKYGFDKAIVTGDDSAIVLDVKQWKDYEGEQLQLITNNNFVLLTSSFDTICSYGDSSKYSIDNLAKGASADQEVYHLTQEDDKIAVFNKDLFDTNWMFNKVITFNGNKAIILPVGQWKDYEGEQLQVVTKDGLLLLLSSYNSKLVYDEHSPMSAYDFAKSYVGDDGEVHDLAEKGSSGFNYDIVDTNYGFNKAIILKDDKAIILPINEWRDYEGEQIQIKIKDGPTIVTASYDTILVNDTNSETNAFDFASSLAPVVVDLANDNDKAVIFNKQMFDLNQGFSNVIFSNDDSSSAVKINKWTDYEGEQIQVELASGDVLLSSSMMLDLVNGGNSNLNASILSKHYVSSDGKNIDKSNNDTQKVVYNKYILDLEQRFKYALKVIDGNVTIIPLSKWKDFYNEDDDEERKPNCEQIQLILPDDTAIVTTAYDTILVDNKSDIMDIAELFRGKDGVITNLEEYVGKPTASTWNFSLFDFQYRFGVAIVGNGPTQQVYPIKNWLDFSEGEQLQINFGDNTGLLTSFVNTTLVDPKTDGIEEIIAKAFSGTLNSDKSEKLVKVYKD